MKIELAILVAAAVGVVVIKTVVHIWLGVHSVVPRDRRGGIEESDRFGIYVGYIFLVCVAARAVSASPLALGATAALIVMAGAGLSLTAMLTLGDSHCENIHPPSHATLKTRGVYGLMRHPMRVGFLLEVAGISLIAGLPWMIVSLLMLSILLIRRSVREERVLVRHYGNAYREYQRTVPAIPFVRLGRAPNPSAERRITHEGAGKRV
jgi:protein-S-isoprenylcysteine O-methyltransferase Ste14